MAPTNRVQLVIADVDGTLVTPEKVLTERARAAVRRLLQAGMAFTITSGRPPRGMKMLIDALELQHPVAAFNGGVIARPDLSVIRELFLSEDVARGVCEIISQQQVDVWLYTGQDWFVQNPKGSHVEREEWAVKFPAKVVPNYASLFGRVVKLVGVSDDYDAVLRAEKAVQNEFGSRVSASRSQPYYLDVTHPDANKGQVVLTFSEMLHVPADNIATIGDGPNDILMFRRSGVCIAMGNASPEVKRAATFVTSSNQEEGFAEAVDRFILQEQSADQRS